ncbi:hypothetical protein CP49_41360 [Bradyrhizobium valentinum]|uniref:Uncharacterized protein n=1 Tax=Bradyrhizobium valentinum TaxID=1518501 RepID=A0A0R3KXH6_9BRAD|nr:hypothetical protein CP49_41360 [Bradyrhizobium valentinum]
MLSIYMDRARSWFPTRTGLSVEQLTVFTAWSLFASSHHDGLNIIMNALLRESVINRNKQGNGRASTRLEETKRLLVIETGIERKRLFVTAS